MPTTNKKKAEKKTEAAAKKASKKIEAASESAHELHSLGADSATGPAKIARRLLDKLSPLSATTRGALRSLATDAQRSDLGAQTKARGVLADGVTMAVTIDQQIAIFPALTETYSPARFAYFLESLLALDALIEGSSAHEAKVGAARGTASTAYERADKARSKLLKRLSRFAGERDIEGKAVAEIPPKGRSNEELRRSIEAAVTLAQSFRARTDAENVALAEVAALDEAIVMKAIAAAGELGGAHVEAALEGRKTSRDSPIVNLEEGNVLLEMAYAMDVFEEAHEDNDVVARLIPGPATRHVFIRKTRPAAAPAPKAAEANGSPAGAVTPPGS
jgi:hypothetical protein